MNTSPVTIQPVLNFSSKNYFLLYYFSMTFCCFHSICKIFFLFAFCLGGIGKSTEKKLTSPSDSFNNFDADVYCRSKNRLIKSDKLDEITTVDTFAGNTILLQCKYCEEKDDGLPKTWSKQKHIFTGNITEMVTSMDNNLMSASSFVAKDHSLVLRDLKKDDGGLYFCKAPYVNTPDKSFNYLLDLVNKSVEDVRGTVLDLKLYTQTYLTPVNKKVAKRSILKTINSYARVVSDWTEWTECDSCFRKEGIRYRTGKCRVRFFPQTRIKANRSKHLKGVVFNDRQNTERPNTTQSIDTPVFRENIVNFGIALACNSPLLLKLSPHLYNMTKSIPEFVLSEKCNDPCQGRPRRKGPRYRKSIILAAGAHLTLVCPDSTIDSQVQWEHNKVRLRPNEGTDYVQGTTEPRLFVDSFNTLYLFEVTEKESGNFTCFVDGFRMQEVRIIVLTRSLFFTKEFTRHLNYLGFVFIICFFAYIAGILVICLRNQAEKKKASRRDAKESKKLLSKKKRAKSGR